MHFCLIASLAVAAFRLQLSSSVYDTVLAASAVPFYWGESLPRKRKSGNAPDPT